MSDCAIVAVTTLTGATRKDVLARAKAVYEFTGEGLPTWAFIALLEDFGLRLVTGKTRSFKGSGKNVWEAAAALKGAKKAALFVDGHVMPVLAGHVSNLCGYGEEPAVFAIEVA